MIRRRGDDHIDFFHGLMFAIGLSLPLWALLLYPLFLS